MASWGNPHSSETNDWLSCKGWDACDPPDPPSNTNRNQLYTLLSGDGHLSTVRFNCCRQLPWLNSTPFVLTPRDFQMPASRSNNKSDSIRNISGQTTSYLTSFGRYLCVQNFICITVSDVIINCEFLLRSPSFHFVYRLNGSTHRLLHLSSPMLLFVIYNLIYNEHKVA